MNQSQSYEEFLDLGLTLDESFDVPGPKGGPSRRRPRAKAPTTLLTVDANNFRALVQHFTGCQPASPSYRGPINLNFEQCSYYPKNMETTKQLVRKEKDDGHHHKLRQESDKSVFFTNNIAAPAHDPSSLTCVSRVDPNPSTDASLTYDSCEMDDDFWGRLTSNDEFWGNLD